MAALERSLRLTEAYRARLLRTREQTAKLIAERWRSAQPEDLAERGRAWTLPAAQQLRIAQELAVSLSSGYVAAYTASELNGAVAAPPALEVDEHAPQLDHLAAQMSGAIITLRAALAAGRPPAEAARMGLNVAMRTTSTQLLTTARSALSGAMVVDERIVGFRRVTSGNACGACLAAATGAIQPSSTTMPAHPHCRCIKEPVVRDATERFRRPTGSEIFLAKSTAEQDALFAGRGGAAKADLIRSGEVPLEALITAAPGRAHVISETPLADLKALAA